MYRLLTICIVIIVFLFVPSKVFAQEYVLPYPGFMPGHPLYKVSAVLDRLEELWSFGSFTKFKYYLAMSDKKLIEAKTLFEYKQYLLGYNALKLSDDHFQSIVRTLESAEKENKNISQKKEVLRNAAIKHIGVLSSLQTQVPESFIWQPEKEKSSILPLKDSLNDSKKQREKEL